MVRGVITSRHVFLHAPVIVFIGKPAPRPRVYVVEK